MRAAAATLASLTAAGASAQLVAAFPLAGTAVERPTGAVGSALGDVRLTPLGCEFGGENGVVVFPDQARYRMTGSFSVYAEATPYALPKNGTSPAGQIVFRGDDQCGLDNFSLCLNYDGMYGFGFYSAGGGGASVHYPAQIGVRTALLGTFDASTRRIRLYVDGFVASEQSTSALPFADLSADWTPGLSIGNVQHPFGPFHRQPFHGRIANVMLFDRAVTPAEAEAAARKLPQR